MPNPMPLEAPVTMATGFSLVFAVIAFLFDRFVIVPTQITARIPLGKANRTRTFEGSRKAKRWKEGLYFDWRGGLGSGLSGVQTTATSQPVSHGREDEPGPQLFCHASQRR